MQRKISYPILILAIFLFFWVNLPQKMVDGLRFLTLLPFVRPPIEGKSNKITALEIENNRLRAQMYQAYEWLHWNQKICEDREILQGTDVRPFLKKRAEYLRALVEKELLSVPATVIFRDPSLWSSTLWVNVGQETNQALQENVIAKNSPVLADGVLVGVVDCVGKKQSRIRLITDSGLRPAVRVARGASQNRELARLLQAVFRQIEKREDLFSSIVEKECCEKNLADLQQKLETEWEDGYLAKGEIHGSSTSFWRSRSPLLKGIGFNYEYADDEGPSRGLSSSVPIIKEGDLLVTSGLDGVFPVGLSVGTVLQVLPLKRGSFAYDISVRPLVSHLNDLQTVFILPPMEKVSTPSE